MTDKSDSLSSSSGGSNFTVGNISNAGNIAIGPNAQVIGAQYSSQPNDEVLKAFTELARIVNVLPNDSNKDVAQDALKGLEAEAGKGEQAQEDAVSNWLNFLAQAAPDVWQVAIDTFTNPLKGLGTVFQKVAERAKSERGASN